MKNGNLRATALVLLLTGCATFKSIMDTIVTDAPIICQLVKTVDPALSPADMMACGAIAADVQLVVGIMESAVYSMSGQKLSSPEPMVVVNIRGVTVMPVPKSIATKALTISKAQQR